MLFKLMIDGKINLLYMSIYKIASRFYIKLRIKLSVFSNLKSKILY